MEFSGVRCKPKSGWRTVLLLLLSFMVITPSHMYATWGDPIHYAVDAGDLKAVKKIIFDDPGLVHSSDQAGRTPLAIAAERGHIEIAKFLLKKGADVNAADGGDPFIPIPLDLAVIKGHKEMAQLLRRYGGEERLDSREIFDAVKSNNLSKVRLLSFLMTRRSPIPCFNSDSSR